MQAGLLTDDEDTEGGASGGERRAKAKKKKRKSKGGKGAGEKEGRAAKPQKVKASAPSPGGRLKRHRDTGAACVCIFSNFVSLENNGPRCQMIEGCSRGVCTTAQTRGFEPESRRKMPLLSLPLSHGQLSTVINLPQCRRITKIRRRC